MCKREGRVCEREEGEDIGALSEGVKSHAD